MPLYTFKCPECGVEAEVIQGMKDSPPVCNKCSKMVPRNLIEMERVFKVNARPESKDGTWDFKMRKLDKLI